MSGNLNIEELFDFAHFDALTWKIRQHMCSVGRNSGDTPYSTAEAIKAWLSYMEDDLVDVIWNQQKVAQQKSDGILRFADILEEDDAVITFNYDTLIEHSMSQAGQAWHYGPVAFRRGHVGKRWDEEHAEQGHSGRPMCRRPIGRLSRCVWPQGRN